MRDPLRDRSAVVGVAVIAFVLCYAAVQIFHPPLWWYLPLERRFSFGARPAEISMDWYGRTLLASVVAVLSGGAAALIRRFLPRTPGAPPWLYALAIAASLGLAFFVYGVRPGD